MVLVHVNTQIHGAKRAFLAHSLQSILDGHSYHPPKCRLGKYYLMYWLSSKEEFPSTLTQHLLLSAAWHLFRPPLLCTQTKHT